MKIGFIGLGTMGKGMVESLLKHGLIVYASNRTKEKLLEIRHENFHPVKSPKDACERSDIAITCVSNDDALKEVFFGSNGILDSLKEGQICIDCSTVSVGLSEALAEECGKRNAGFIDAPVTGSKAGAESGTLMFMAGGEKQHIEECMPVFNAMGRKLVYCGPHGYGQRAKLALNLSQSLVLQGYLEGLVLGVKNGVPIESMMDILDNSGARSGASSGKSQRIIQRDFSPHFKLWLMNKDVRLAEKEMQKLGLDLPMTKALLTVFDEAMKSGLAEEDFSAIVKVLEKKSGLTLAR